MAAKSHNRTKNVGFYKIGLGGKDEVNKRKWQLKTFSTILKENGHTNVNAVTVLELLSFQKVCRINVFFWMSQHDVTFYSQTLIGCPDHCKFCFCWRLFETV